LVTDKIVVLTTCDSEEQAERLARRLVEDRLAACTNIIPGVRSIYRWEGQIEAATEFLLIIKSRRDIFPKLREAIAQLHSYEIPEVIALPVADGSETYLNWLDRELAP
jgi:periplasmic divalent cation tolerance protein